MAAKKEIRFGSINQAGILAGSSGEGLQLQTINGVKYGSYFFAAGLGLDNYYLRSIPLFLHISKTMGKKTSTPYLYADGGYNIPWVSDNDNKDAFWEVEKTTGGAYYEIGLGYQVPAFKNSRLVLSAGYSYKQLSQKVNSMPWILVPPTPPEAFETYRYHLRRIAIKAGFKF